MNLWYFCAWIRVAARAKCGRQTMRIQILSHCYSSNLGDYIKTHDFDQIMVRHRAKCVFIVCKVSVRCLKFPQSTSHFFVAEARQLEAEWSSGWLGPFGPSKPASMLSGYIIPWSRLHSSAYLILRIIIHIFLIFPLLLFFIDFVLFFSMPVTTYEPWTIWLIYTLIGNRNMII